MAQHFSLLTPKQGPGKAYSLLQTMTWPRPDITIY